MNHPIENRYRYGIVYDKNGQIIGFNLSPDVCIGLTDEEIERALEAYVKRKHELPSVQPEIIRCGQCKYAEAADSEDSQDGYTCQFHRGSVWFSGSYCSWAERRQNG